MILKTLTRGPSHGYAVARFIEETTGDAFLIEDGSLYPALYRLERKGWVEAEWGTSELGRRAKLYRLTDAGPRAAGRGNGDLEEVLRRRLEGVCDMKRSLRSWLWRVPLDQEFDEEIALHIEMRTRELIAEGMDPAEARAMAIRKMGDVASLKRDVCGPWQKARSRDERDPVARRVARRRQVRVPAVARRAGVHAGRDADAGARHRRQQRDLRARRRDAAAAAAVRRRRAARHDLGDIGRHAARLRVAAEHAGLEVAQPDVRDHRRLHAVDGQHGDVRTRRQRADGVAAVGDVGHLRRARRQADCRPDVLSRRRSSSGAAAS